MLNTGGQGICSTDLHHRSPWGVVQMVRCSDCGAYRTADMPTPDQVTEMYDSDAIYSPPTEADYRDSKRHVTLIASEFGRPCPEHSRRLLEIGCNSGYALDAFQEQGWDVTGC